MKKILLTIGSMTTVMAPVVTVISCGKKDINTNGEKKDTPNSSGAEGATLNEISTNISQAKTTAKNEIDAVLSEQSCKEEQQLITLSNTAKDSIDNAENRQEIDKIVSEFKTNIKSANTLAESTKKESESLKAKEHEGQEIVHNEQNSQSTEQTDGQQPAQPAQNSQLGGQEQTVTHQVSEQELLKTKQSELHTLIENAKSANEALLQKCMLNPTAPNSPKAMNMLMLANNNLEKITISSSTEFEAAKAKVAENTKTQADVDKVLNPVIVNTQQNGGVSEQNLVSNSNPEQTVTHQVSEQELLKTKQSELHTLIENAKTGNQSLLNKYMTDPKLLMVPNMPQVMNMLSSANDNLEQITISSSTEFEAAKAKVAENAKTQADIDAILHPRMS